MEYRVDVFDNNGHTKNFFATEEAAREFAAAKDGIVFLLKEVVDGFYDIIEEVKVR